MRFLLLGMVNKKKKKYPGVSQNVSRVLTYLFCHRLFH